MQDYILEVCVDSVESALRQSGRCNTTGIMCKPCDRRTTPGYTLFEQVKKKRVFLSEC